MFFKETILGGHIAIKSVINIETGTVNIDRTTVLIIADDPVCPAGTIKLASFKTDKKFPKRENPSPFPVTSL